MSLGVAHVQAKLAGALVERVALPWDCPLLIAGAASALPRLTIRVPEMKDEQFMIAVLSLGNWRENYR